MVVFRVTMLAADQGDALWIDYGPDGPTYRMLIDAGTPTTGEAVSSRIEASTEERRRFELLVVTHIDNDHIGGVLRLLSSQPFGMTVGEVWFNERRHLEIPDPSMLGAVDGEILGLFLDRLKWRWNRRFHGGPVVVPPGERGLPCFRLRGGMRVTLLSPSPAQLLNLKTAWRKELKEKHVDPKAPPGEYLRQLSAAMDRRQLVPPDLLGDDERASVDELAEQRFIQDPSPTNGSTIAVLAEYRGKSCLLLGDAVPDMVLDSIRRLLRARGQPKLIVDAVKLPHHGSRYNVSNELVEPLVSPRWLFSTSGKRYEHPDAAAVARVVRANRGRNVTLYFNYPKGTNPKADRWDRSATKEDWGYDTRFAAGPSGGQDVDL